MRGRRKGGQDCWTALDGLRFRARRLAARPHARPLAVAPGVGNMPPQPAVGIAPARPLTGGGASRAAEVLAGAGGCGNNWAHGYAQGHERAAADAPAVERVAEAVRRHCEACSVTPALVVCHSLGGGTGAGMGSAIVERLRREYPSALLASVAVAPDMESGPAAQSLNVALSMQWLHEYADAVLLWRNGELAAAARRAAKRGGTNANDAGLTMARMNAHVAAPLLGLLAPAAGVRVATGGAALGAMGCLQGVVAEVCPHPACRLATAASAPNALRHPAVGKGGGTTAGRPRSASRRSATQAAAMEPSWVELGRALETQLPRADELDHGRPATCSAALVVLRGCGADGRQDAAAARAVLASARGLGGDTSAVCVPAAAPAALGGGRCVTAAAARGDAVGLLDEVALRGRALLDAGAFVHWYERHGCPADALQDALEALEEAAADARWWHCG